MSDRVWSVGQQVRRAWFCGAALAATLAASPSIAAERYALDIPAGPLDEAILRVAKQTHHQVFFRPGLIAGYRAAALKGQYTPDQALQLLLASTDISASRAGPHLLVLQRTAPAPASRQPVQEADDARPFGVATAPIDDVGPRAPTVVADPVRGPMAPTDVEAVEVTGSHIRGAAPASPLVVLDRTALERTGQATLVEALRMLPANFSGGAGEGNSLTGADSVGRNTSFGSGLNLRGLGNGATLVLINGRRLAGSGTFGDYTDVSSIPSAAVQRVEVLLDGASALYGSDAVGGVVNIITRRDFEGVEARLLAGIGAKGEPAQGQASLTWGHRWGGGGLVLSYEAQRRDRLVSADRDFAASADLRPFGGSDFRITNAFPGNVLVAAPGASTLVPTFAIPPGQNGVGLRPADFQQGVVNRQNQRLGQDLLPRQTMNAIYAAIDQSAGAVELSADARFSARRYKARFASSISTFSVGRSNPFFVSPNGASTNQISYSFANDIPNVTSAGLVETLSTSFGAKLRLPQAWRAEAYGAFGREVSEIRGYDLVNSLILAEALGNIADRADTPYSAARDGFFNPYSGIAGSNPAAVRAAIGSGETYARIRSQVMSANIQADGPLWSLPAGDLKLAVGAQARRETLVRTGFNWFATATPAATTPTDAARNVTAAFAELRLPLFSDRNARPGLQRLEISLAGRIEHYQGIGTTTRPMAGVVWSPVSDLQIRSTYSRSFRAPALRELYDPASFSPTLQTVSGARILVLQQTGGNTSLKPESADSFTAGIDYQPSAIPGLKLSLTGFDIKFHNRIDRPVGSSIANALIDPNLTTFVRRIAPGSNPVDLALITALINDRAFSSTGGAFLPTEYGAIVDSRYVNTTTLHVRGFDASANYSFEVHGDRVKLGAAGSYLTDYERQFTPTSVVIERVNVANNPLRVQSRLTADWTRGRLTLGGALNYTGRYKDLAGARIGGFARFDTQARLAAADQGPLAGVNILVNVRNVFDREPPFYNNTAGIAYDSANADPIGRFVSLQLTRSW